MPPVSVKLEPCPRAEVHEFEMCGKERGKSMVSGYGCTAGDHTGYTPAVVGCGLCGHAWCVDCIPMERRPTKRSRRHG